MTTTPIEQEVTNLLPCPFSHNFDQLRLAQERTEPYVSDEDGEFAVVCRVCGGSTRLYYGRDMAIRAWNTRAAAAADGQVAQGKYQGKGGDEDAVCVACGSKAWAHRCPDTKMTRLLKIARETAAASPPTAPHEPPPTVRFGFEAGFDAGVEAEIARCSPQPQRDAPRQFSTGWRRK